MIAIESPSVSEWGVEELEMTVLGAALLSSRSADAVIAQCVSETFSRPVHRDVFAAVKRLRERGSEADLVTVNAEMRDQKLADYLYRMMELVPSTSHCQTYISEVLRHAAIRRLKSNAQRYLREFDDHPDLQELLSKAGRIAEGVRHPNRYAVDLGDVLDGMDLASGDRGVETGFPSLDASIATGGYPAGHMSIVAANTGAGKSAFMLGSACHQAFDAGGRIAYGTFSDLTRENLLRRILRQRTGWTKRPNEPLRREEFEREVEYIKANAPLFSVYDASSRDDNSVEAFTAWLSQEHERDPFRLVFCDYLQVMRSNDRNAQDRVRNLEVVSKVLDRWAHQYLVPVVAGTQVTESKDEGRSVRYSKDLLMDCGWYLDIAGERADNDHAVVVKVRKSRFGGTGKEIQLAWRSAFSKFADRLGGQ